MRLCDIKGNPVWHDCRTGFGDMLRSALLDIPVIAAHGPIYEKDPAEEILAPFRRSAAQTDWVLEEIQLAPKEILEKARLVRTKEVERLLGEFSSDLDVLYDWSRAGLVLEIARRWGVNVFARGILHLNWKLKGTVTGRFGCDSIKDQNWMFNPLSLGPDDRWRIEPRDFDRHIVVLDFKGMDVCSMISIVPGLAEIYDGYPDPHLRTAEITGLSRENAKQGFLSWAYGASFAAFPKIGKAFDDSFPFVKSFTKNKSHGDFARKVQETSARAFRAALSRALPLLVTEDHIPMMAVHDELSIDSKIDSMNSIDKIVCALESGASDRIGVPYRIGMQTGSNYEEAKMK